MAEVRWTPQAADDLEAICLFIARDAPQVAAAFADRVLRATDQLVMPKESSFSPLRQALIPRVKESDSAARRGNPATNIRTLMNADHR